MSNIKLSSFFWIFGLFLIQNSLNYIFPGKMPNCILVGVLCYALMDGPLTGMILGAFGGFFLDLLGTNTLGFSMFSYSLLGALVGFMSTRIFRENILTEILLPCLGYYGVTILEVMAVKYQSGESIGVEVLIEGFLVWPFLTTMIVSPFIFSFLGKSTNPSHRNRPFTIR